MRGGSATPQVPPATAAARNDPGLVVPDSGSRGATVPCGRARRGAGERSTTNATKRSRSAAIPRRWPQSGRNAPHGHLLVVGAFYESPYHSSSMARSIGPGRPYAAPPAPPFRRPTGCDTVFPAVAASDAKCGGGCDHRHLSQSLHASRGGLCHPSLHIADPDGRPRPSKAISVDSTSAYSSPPRVLPHLQTASALSGKAKNAAIC